MVQATIVNFEKGVGCLTDTVLESPKPFLASVSGPIPALTGVFIRELELELHKFGLRGQVNYIGIPPRAYPIISYFIVKDSAKLEPSEADGYFMRHFNKRADKHAYVNDDETVTILAA